jgi:hypothetical protein
LRLQPLPARFVETRDALHQVAFFAVAPARYQAEGRMGLRAAPGGFGTPEFDGRIARVEGNTLVHEQSDAVASQTITTIGAAAGFFGVEYATDWYEQGFRDPLAPVGPDVELTVDDDAGRALGAWFGFGYDVLETLRSHGSEGDEVSTVQLWPEHFDPAIEMGSEDKGLRASYGLSPGDRAHDEPYVYVAPWGEIDRTLSYWNDEVFNGSSLGYAELLTASDPAKMALDFLLEGHRLIQAD